MEVLEMNGLSDVRLAFHSHELEEDAPLVRKALPARTAATPAGMSRWALYRHRWVSRRTLFELTDDELRDIGLDFRQARIEAMKPFWRM
jgi:uncharacterized protein YjiS (DUF1127 family)